jgi:glutamine synthetase adenylyltransferase
VLVAQAVVETTETMEIILFLAQLQALVEGMVLLVALRAATHLMEVLVALVAGAQVMEALVVRLPHLGKEMRVVLVQDMVPAQEEGLVP